MFERFTEEARQVVVLAQEEARSLKHEQIGPEHILLGLLREQDGLAGQLLRGLGITVEPVRAEVVQSVGAGEGVPSGQIPFIPRAKEVLELALREALSLDLHYVGTEHILLGLLRQEGLAVRILGDLGGDAEEIREALTITEASALGQLDEGARHAVILAQQEARVLKRNYIGTEHILLGLLRERKGVAARALHALDVTIDRALAEEARLVGAGEEVTSGQLPFTPRTKRVFELAHRESLSLGHDYLGTEHVLLALVRECEGLAVRILLDLGADSEKIRHEVIRRLSVARGPPGRPERTKEPSRQDTTSRSESDFPSPGELSDEELEHLIQRLTGKERTVASVLARVHYERRIVQGQIDILRTEQVSRRKRRHDQ